MNNVLLFIGGLLVAALAALFAVPHFIDWNGYRGVFEEEASKVLGRDVRVGGAVNVRFLPTPYVRFEKVRLADPTGQTGEPFVRADSFTMRLSGPALLRGVLEANEIELDRPELTLALDNAGGGNWTTIQIKAGALPFIPQNVALHSVKITDGAIGFYNAEAQQIGRAEHIEGEFSAEALQGPFKFKGAVLWGGEVRDVRFATTPPDAEGRLQLKASMRGLASGTSYALDTIVADLSGKPHITGGLTGKIPLQPAASAIEGTQAGPVVIDLTSRIDANTGGAKISDVTLTVENVAEPQLISGSASAVWGAAPRLDVALTSKWLDLDRLAGAGQDSATFLRIKQLGLAMLRGLAGNGETSALIEIDQVKLGGETAGAMKIDAARRGPAVRLKELKAGLPGGSRLDVSGDLKDGDGKISFAGAGYVQGNNFARLLDWAAKSGANLDVKADGPFSAEGQVQITDDRLELKDATAEIGGKSFSGDVVVSGDSRRRVAVTLEAASIDTTQLFPATARALDESLRRALGIAIAAPVTPEATGNTSGSAPGRDGDMSVRVLAGELKHLDKTFRDVDATVRMDGGKIHIPSAKFTTPAGLAIGVEARISDAGNQPKGTLAYDFVASSSAAMKDIAAFTGLASILPEAHLERLTNAKLAGLVRLSNRHAGNADISVDGTLQSARVTGSAEFDGGLQGWRSGLSRVRVSARSPALATVMSAFGFSQSTQSSPVTSESELVFASSGTMSDGAAANVNIAAPGLSSRYDGGFTINDDGDVRLAGTVRIDAENAADALSAAGIPSSGGISGHKLSGTVSATREDRKWTLASRGLKVGASTIRGTATLLRDDAGGLAVSGDVFTDTLTVAGLFAPIYDAAPDVKAEAQGAATAPTEPGIWPSGTFNFASFASLTGTVRLDYKTLNLHRGLIAHDGKLELAFAPEKVAISSIEGTAAGGALSGQLEFSKALGGIKFDGALKIADAELALLSAKGSGTATIESKASAQAQSMAGLVSVLGGSGSITLEDSAVPAPGPSTAAAVITPMLSHKIRNQGDEVTVALQAAVADARADLGTRTIPFVISDGVAKLDKQTLQSAEGIVTSATVVELTTFAIDSAWKLAAVVPPLPAPPEPVPGWAPPAPKPPLPAASVVYTGNLGALTEIVVNVDAADMQRELAVRQLERNVEDLERLRKIDEYSAKVERERRQAIEAERAAAAAAARAAVQKPPAAPQVLPPVLPESAGSTGDGQSAAPPPPETAQPPNAAAPEASDGATVAPNAVQEGADAAPPVPAPQPAVRPQPARNPAPRPSQARRTSSDEVMRSLGGYP